MPKIVIDIRDLRSNSGNEAVEDLATFLKEQLGTEVNTPSVDEIEIDTGKHSKPFARTVLRKFLHRTELKKELRIIAGKEQSLVIKKRKITEEEE